MQQEHRKNNLWIIRKRSGLSQKAVAALLGHRCTSILSAYEHGKRIPSLLLGLKLQNIYSVPLQEIFTGLHSQATLEIETVKQRLPGIPKKRIE